MTHRAPLIKNPGDDLAPTCRDVTLYYLTAFFIELVVFFLPHLSSLHDLATLRQIWKIELCVATPWFSLLHFAVTELKISMRLDDKHRPVAGKPGRFPEFI